MREVLCELFIYFETRQSGNIVVDISDVSIDVFLELLNLDVVVPNEI